MTVMRNEFVLISQDLSGVTAGEVKGGGTVGGQRCSLNARILEF